MKHPILIDCQPSTPVARILKRKSTLRNAKAKTINKTNITSKGDIIDAITQVRNDNKECTRCKFATEKNIDIHP